MSATTLPLRRVVRNIVEPSNEPRPTLTLDGLEGGTGRVVGELEVMSPEGQVAFEPGDVLFGKLRPYLSKSHLVTRPMQGTGELLVLRPAPELDPRFLFYTTLSAPWLNLATQSSYGLKMPRTSWDELATFPLRLPDLEEQRRIADFLGDHVARIESMETLRHAQHSTLDEVAMHVLADAARALWPSVAPPLVSWFPAGRDGWRLLRVSWIAKCLDGFRVPLSATERSSQSGVYPYYGVLSATLGDDVQVVWRHCW